MPLIRGIYGTREGRSANATRLVAAFGQKTLLYWENARETLYRTEHLALDGVILP